jgi:DNA-binding GntR family transcriptional regulator
VRTLKDVAPKKSTQASAVYERLRADIVSCVIMPGQKLQMEMLRERYSAGASPVREALNRLVTEGLVTQVDQKGFTAAPVSVDQVLDLTLARCWIGEQALRASLRQGDAEWEERVILAFHRWERALSASGGSRDEAFGKVQALHADFHRALLSACGSQWALNFWDVLFDSAQRYQVMSLRRSVERRSDPVAEHREIMEAALARDESKAVELHDQHMRLTAKIVMESDGDREK